MVQNDMQFVEEENENIDEDVKTEIEDDFYDDHIKDCDEESNGDDDRQRRHHDMALPRL